MDEWPDGRSSDLLYAGASTEFKRSIQEYCCGICQKIPASYLHKINELILKGASAGLEVNDPRTGDGTGFSEDRCRRCMDYCTNKDARTKKWVKIHAVINVKLRLMTEFLVTDSNAADVRGMCKMLGELGPIPDDFCLDSAHLSRETCDIIERDCQVCEAWVILLAF